MDRACSSYGGEVYTGFWWGNLRERDHLEDPGRDGRIILRWIFRKWDLRVWTGLMWPSIRDRWQALVNAGMKLWAPYNVGNFLTT